MGKIVKIFVKEFGYFIRSESEKAAKIAAIRKQYPSPKYSVTSSTSKKDGLTFLTVEVWK